jgi:hypothetical protein
VSEDGGAEKVFAEGAQTGVAVARFIQPGHTYVFRLYPSAAARSPIASAVLRRG